MGVCQVSLGEAAAAAEPGGPHGPVDATWLILQRLDDLRRGQDDLRGDVRSLRTELKADLIGLRDEVKADGKVLRDEFKTDLTGLRDELKSDIASLGMEIDSVRNWSLGLLLLAILGLLAKLLLPGA